MRRMLRKPIAVRGDFVVIGGYGFTRFECGGGFFLDLFGLRAEVSWERWPRWRIVFDLDKPPPWDRIVIWCGNLSVEIGRAYSGFLASCPFWKDTLEGLG